MINEELDTNNVTLDRCSKIETLNLSFLETLGLKTVIFVGGQEPSKFFKEFFERCCIEWYVVKTAEVTSTLDPLNLAGSKRDNEINSNKSPQKLAKVSYELNDNDDLMLIKSTCLIKAFKLLLDTQNHNTLLVDKTSIVVGILRKIQKWNISSIVNEYRLFTGKNSNYFAETFLEIINVRIIQQHDDSSTNSIDDADIERYMNKENGIYRAPHWEVVRETDLLMPPSLPWHLFEVLKEMEGENDNVTSERNPSKVPNMSRTHSNLGIFGNRYRLAFNKQERADYEYYKSLNTNTLVLTIPKETLLPAWFVFQRDLWEKENVKEEHNFYKEKIFI